MRKVLFFLIALVAIVAIAVVAAPRLINWNTFKPDIADAVRDATGQELVIAGDLDVSLIPRIEVRAQAVQVRDADGESVASVGDIDAVIGLWPLVSRTVVIERLIVRQPTLALSIDEAGRGNWTTVDIGAAEGEGDEDDGADEALPFSDIQLGEVRIEDGAFSFADARTGQFLGVTDLAVDVTMPDMGQPLALSLRATVNDEPVTLSLDLRTPRALLARQSVEVVAELSAPAVAMRLDGSGTAARHAIRCRHVCARHPVGRCARHPVGRCARGLAGSPAGRQPARPGGH